MSNSDSDIEELKKQTEVGTRINQSEEPQQENEFVEELIEQIAAVRDGDRSPMFGARDDLTAAFLVTLSERPDDLQKAGTQLQETLDREVDPEAIDKSTIIRLAIRVGLNEGMPEYAEHLSEAAAEYARRRM